MGIYGALTTAVSGLRAQSTALENISSNIANSQTTGYKRIETSFIDMIPDAPFKQQIPGAVLSQSRATNNVSGDIKNVTNGTNMAINGNGFFVVDTQTGQSDGNPIFAGASLYTRRGDFDVDKYGYLVNGAGYTLKGLPIDRSTGNVSGSVPEVIKLTNDFLPALRTSRVDYQLNLPSLPKNAAYDANVPGSELLDTADYSAGGDPTVAGDGVVLGADDETFQRNSITGGAITVYADNGAPVNLQMRWAKVDSAASGGEDTWNLFYLSNGAATGTQPKWTNVGVDYKFDSSGNMNPPVVQTTLSNLTVDGVEVGDVQLQHGRGGLTQFADTSGSVSTSGLAQNGYPAGSFDSVSISDGGRIVATYSNGQQVDLAQVVTANFNAANQLKRLDGGAFAATSESGEAILGTQGGIVGSALEASNTDISEEFTKLIVTQQAYAAGTRIISSANDMLQEALNMVR